MHIQLHKLATREGPMARAPLYRHLLAGNPGGATTEQPPTTATTFKAHGSVSYGSETSLDTNMVIILGALLCALICALGVNSIIRWALQCISHLTGSHRHHQRQEVAVDLAVTGCRGGLRRSAIGQIPVTIYDYNQSNTGVISTDCIICLGEFVDGEKIRVLPKCKHGFHVTCIDTWLLSHSSCPTCRESLSECAGNRSWNGGGQGQVANEVMVIGVL